MGGIGKSAVALEIAKRSLQSRLVEQAIYISSPQVAPWETAAGSESEGVGFPSILNTILGQLDINLGSEPLDVKARRVQRLLRQKRLLVILDNLETWHEPQDRLVHQLGLLFDHSKALLTSRRRFTGNVYPIHLTGLDSREAQDFIRYEAGEKNIPRVGALSEDQLAAIIEVTGGSPKAMQVVIGSLYHLDIAVVLQHLQEVRPLREDLNEDDLIAFFKSIFIPSWELLSLHARKLLFVMAHHPPETGGRIEALRAISGLSQPDLITSIDELWRLSFLEVREAVDGLSIRYYLHPLTQHFIKSDIARR